MAQEATDRRADVQLLPALPTLVMFRCHSASYLPPTFWLRGMELPHITAALCRCWRIHATDRLCLPSLHECSTLHPAMSAAMVSEVSFYQCWWYNFTADFPGEQKKLPLSEATFHFLKTCDSYLNNYWPHIYSAVCSSVTAGCSWALQWRAWRLAGGHMSPHLALTRHLVTPTPQIISNTAIKQ